MRELFRRPAGMLKMPEDDRHVFHVLCVWYLDSNPTLHKHMLLKRPVRCRINQDLFISRPDCCFRVKCLRMACTFFFCCEVGYLVW